MTPVAEAADAARRGPLRILVWAQLRCASDLTLATTELDAIVGLGSDVCTVEVVEDGAWRDLARAVDVYEPDVFHFIGHGKRGSLTALDATGSGALAEHRIPPQRLVTAFRRASGPRGIFLNGCDTAHWAPHFIPQDGWVIGTTRPVGDEAAAFFAPLFYEHLLGGESDATAFDRAFLDYQTAAMPGERLPPLVRWVADPDEDDWLHKIFSREAFARSTIDEASLAELDDAIEGVRRSLTLGKLATRVAVQGSSTVHCRSPLGRSLIASLSPRLTAVAADVRQLRSEFPQLERFAGQWTHLPQADRVRLFYLADRLDESRNQLLDVVNSELPPRKQFPRLVRSSVIQYG